MSVFPSEIETLLGRHSAVLGSGVVGQPDPEKGQVPGAFVRLSPRDVGRVSEQELTEWCRQNMATYKVPIVRIVRELPLTTTGKVKKEELKRALEAPAR